jgi:transposase-like protein
MSQPRTSPYKRARATRALREGKSFAQTAREIGVNKRTITRWMKDARPS